MMHLIREILEIATAALSAAGVGYYALALWSARAFLRVQRAMGKGEPASFTPAVSILKPLKGTDPGMYESFCSHCLQDYPEYEIVFGVSEPDDPAIALVERLKAEFPQRTIRLVHCPKTLGTNMKVSNLVQMLPEARYEYLVVNDSDIRAERDYLRKVMAPLERSEVGLVTCLYRGMASGTLGSELEALGITADFVPGVLAAWKLEDGIHFGLGSTLAFRMQNLKAIGGFEELVDYLADDYQLGKRIADSGLNIGIAGAIVETHLPKYAFAGYLRHQMRWARTVRESRKWGYVGTVVTFAVWWAALAVILSAGAIWAWALLGLVLAGRIGLAALVGNSVLHDGKAYSRIWLLPLRDVLGFGIWLASFFGHTISWRGRRFLLRHGRLVPLVQDNDSTSLPAAES